MTDQTLNLDINDLLNIEFALRDAAARWDAAKDAREAAALAELMHAARRHARDDGTGEASATLTYSAAPSVAEAFGKVSA